MRGWLALMLVAACGKAKPTAYDAARPHDARPPDAQASHADASSGWGTIGTSSNHGRFDPLLMSVGTIAVDGDLAKEIVHRYIRRNAARLSSCYEPALAANPELVVAVQVRFTIAPAGTVTEATATGIEPAIDTCVVDAVKAIEFPDPKGGPAHVTCPLRFHPAVEPPR
jgi:outer membrane biosynthesis protein TonB